MDTWGVLGGVWDLMRQGTHGRLDEKAELDGFAGRIERVLSSGRDVPRDAGGSPGAACEPPGFPGAPPTALFPAAAGAMRALPKVPLRTQLPFAELIYPKPGTRRASTLVYRAGGRVFKIALGADAAARLHREARFLAGPLAGYACFADVYQLGEVSDTRLSPEPLACLSERYVEGLPADAWVERRAYGPASGSARRERIVGAVYERLLGVLSVVHRAGIVHRDIHPGNILIDDAGSVHLIDFGCAVTFAEAEAAARDPALRECVISRGYEAPEAHVGGPYTPRTDIYAASAVAAQLAYGTRAAAELPPTPLGRRLSRVLG